ncbi:MAG: hypothetical protein JW765_08565 [Deltaproteobacteria bacterium]|nr:hypothetical protein [Candidatus Zymogenaceae bacterium]
MDRRILWLRISYWAGAVLDGLWVIPMLVPQLGMAIYGIEGIEVTGGIRYTLAVGAALMAGWTFLLIWADRKPVERRGIIILTMFPVKLGLDLTTIYLFVYGYVTVSDMVPSWILAAALYVLFIFSYVNSASLVKSPEKKG